MEKSGESSPVILLGKEWFSGGLANAVSSAILNPMDVSKTRLQTEISSIKAGADITKIPRLSTVLVTLYKEGGLIGLWKPGLTASVAREFLNSGPRAGLYVPVRKQIVAMLGMQDEVNESSFLPKVLAAICTGTIGAIVANPVDVVKIRLMVNSTAYSSLISGVFHVYKQEGIYGLYKGLVPSTLRGNYNVAYYLILQYYYFLLHFDVAAFIAVGELATYDHSKTILKKYVGMQEGSYLHTTASLITGFVAATVAAPFDLIKTR